MVYLINYIIQNKAISKLLKYKHIFKSEIYSFIYSFIRKYLLTACYVSNTVLGPKNTCSIYWSGESRQV